MSTLLLESSGLQVTLSVTSTPNQLLKGDGKSWHFSKKSDLTQWLLKSTSMYFAMRQIFLTYTVKYCPEADNVTILLLQQKLIYKLINDHNIKLFSAIHSKVVDYKKKSKPEKQNHQQLLQCQLHERGLQDTIVWFYLASIQCYICQFHTPH